MDRLTKRVGAGEAVPVADGDICAPFTQAGLCKTGAFGGFQRKWERHCNDECTLGMMIDALAAYEDTGLAPEEVAGLARAKEEGRLVVPYKPGEIVYYCGESESGEKRIFECKTMDVDGIAILDNLDSLTRQVIFAEPKDVFPVRETAEAALEGARSLE